ncbi:MAG: rRNA maturation RNase YbeY [Chloroflexota bacterium]
MEIDILIDEAPEGGLEASWLRLIASQVLTAEGADTNTELGFLITGQERIRQLNQRYRGKDEPTDVLTFAMTDETDTTLFPTPPDGIQHLGEVIISYPQAAIQAEEHRHSVKREIAVLTIHGMLHLLGYDHEEPAGERQMRAREGELLSDLEGELA